MQLHHDFPPLPIGRCGCVFFGSFFATLCSFLSPFVRYHSLKKCCSECATPRGSRKKRPLFISLRSKLDGTDTKRLISKGSLQTNMQGLCHLLFNHCISTCLDVMIYIYIWAHEHIAKPKKNTTMDYMG